MIYCLGTYRWAFVSWEEVVVIFPLFVNACRWILTGCPQQTAFRTEKCASAGKKLKRKSSLHTFKGGWKKKTFCFLFNQYFSWFKHYSQYFTTKHCCTESLCGDIIKVWDVQKHVRRCVSLLINLQNMMSVSLESPCLWSFHGTGYIHCFIVYCWCCDHDPGPDCWSCNCFFRLLSSSTRLCTARLWQSASGSPSATSVDVETHYWLFLSVHWACCACTQPWHFLSTINNPVWEEIVSFAQCRTAPCHSLHTKLLLSSKRNSESNCWWANGVMDGPV